ncbi:MAG: hypothetical protein E5V65_07710 [Mesorhizobium sp.]|nr:MAG: hypothetical protein E5V65_07710 [Mesorhizobium sp.]
MSAPTSIRFRVDPRLVSPEKAARWLFLTMDDFNKALPALQKEGFPKPCPVTGHYDMRALEAWQDKRSGLAGGLPVEDRAAVMRERIASLG